MLAPNLKDGARRTPRPAGAGVGRLGARPAGRPAPPGLGGRSTGVATLVARGYLQDGDRTACGARATSSSTCGSCSTGAPAAVPTSSRAGPGRRGAPRRRPRRRRAGGHDRRSGAGGHVDHVRPVVAACVAAGEGPGPAARAPARRWATGSRCATAGSRSSTPISRSTRGGAGCSRRVPRRPEPALERDTLNRNRRARRRRVDARGPRRVHRALAERAQRDPASSRRSTTSACSCACCRSGRTRGRGRNATRITASPSTGTRSKQSGECAAILASVGASTADVARRAWRRRACCSPGCSTTSARAGPGDHSEVGAEPPATVARRSGSTKPGTEILGGWCRTISSWPTPLPAATSTTRAHDHPLRPSGRRPQTARRSLRADVGRLAGAGPRGVELQQSLRSCKSCG